MVDRFNRLQFSRYESDGGVDGKIESVMSATILKWNMVFDM